jgi:hypothetical protein
MLSRHVIAIRRNEETFLFIMWTMYPAVRPRPAGDSEMLMAQQRPSPPVAATGAGHGDPCRGRGSGGSPTDGLVQGRRPVLRRIRDAAWAAAVTVAVGPAARPLTAWAVGRAAQVVRGEAAAARLLHLLDQSGAAQVVTASRDGGAGGG